MAESDKKLGGSKSQRNKKPKVLVKVLNPLSKKYNLPYRRHQTVRIDAVIAKKAADNKDVQIL